MPSVVLLSPVKIAVDAMVVEVQSVRPLTGRPREIRSPPRAARAWPCTPVRRASRRIASSVARSVAGPLAPMSTATPDDPVPVSAVSRPDTPVMARASHVGDPRSTEVSHRLLVYLRWNGLKGHKQLQQAGHGAAYYAASACTRKGYSNTCAN